MLFLYTAFFWVFFSVCLAIWAHKWGRPSFLYLVVAVIFSPLVAAVVLFLRGKNEDVTRERAIRSGTHQSCPQCAELVSSKATKCRYCGSVLSLSTPAGQPTGDDFFL